MLKKKKKKNNATEKNTIEMQPRGKKMYFKKS